MRVCACVGGGGGSALFRRLRWKRGLLVMKLNWMDECLYVHSSSYTGVKIRIIIIRIIRPLYHARLQNKKGFRCSNGSRIVVVVVV